MSQTPNHWATALETPGGVIRDIFEGVTNAQAITRLRTYARSQGIQEAEMTDAQVGQAIVTAWNADVLRDHKWGIAIESPLGTIRRTFTVSNQQAIESLRTYAATLDISESEMTDAQMGMAILELWAQEIINANLSRFLGDLNTQVDAQAQAQKTANLLAAQQQASL